MVTNTGAWLSKNLQSRQGVSKPEVTAMANTRFPHPLQTSLTKHSSYPLSLELPQDHLFNMAPHFNMAPDIAPPRGSAFKVNSNATSRATPPAGMT